MKKIFIITSFVVSSLFSFGQMDYKFNYQAVVRNGSGALVSNGANVAFRLSILEGSATGTPLYVETQTAIVNNNQGLVNLIIGDGIATTGVMLFSANFQDLSLDRYLKVEVDPTGGTSYSDMGATKLQFVPFAAHSFTSSYAESAANGTQWDNGASNSISYSSGNVNIGTNTPLTSGTLNVEQSIASGSVSEVTQTNTNSNAIAFRARTLTTGFTGQAIHGQNSGGGYGIVGSTLGTTTGIGVHGTSSGNSGFGVYGLGATGVSARSNATNGIAIDLDGFIKVNGTKTAFKTTPLVSAVSNITLSYGGASSTDMVFVTPVNSSTTMPSWSLIWTSPNWVLWNASDDAIPSNFPAGTSFNVLIIKQ